MNSKNEINYELIKDIATLNDSNKYSKRVTLMDWHNVVDDDGSHLPHIMLDIRTWKKVSGKYIPTHGITLNRRQARRLIKVLTDFVNLEDIDD